MEKSSSKYFNTARRIDEAFLKILYKKDFEYITVKEICEEAKVNRSTFYLHYETLGDLLDETMEYIVEKFCNHFDGITIDVKNTPVKDLYLITPQYLVPWLNFIKENQKIFLTIFKRHKTLNISRYYDEIFNDFIVPILERNNVPKSEQEYIFLFYVEGIMGVVKKWIKEGCESSVDYITTLICKYIKSHND